ncbi:MAG: RNA polymerase sigma factor [Myxococcales bacterium]|jgi:RNA polymerase sigma-70 factor (ECF subfamily)
MVEAFEEVAAAGCASLTEPLERAGSDAPPASAPDSAELRRERQLLRRLRRGDERAFVELVREHQDRVYDLLVRMLGDREEALDLSQEVFASIHASVARFRGESRLSTWIFRVAKNHCLNRLKYLQRRHRNRSTEISSVPERELEACAPSRRPDEHIAESELRALVRRGIALLDEEHRLLLVLRDIEGLSYHEIAEITEQPEGTVKSRLHRARASLARIVAQLEKE